MLQAWYFPSFNGDCRLQAHPDNPERECLLSITRPTPDERRMLGLLEKAFNERGWLADADRKSMTAPMSWWRTGRVRVLASIVDVGPVVTSIVKAGANVLTVIRSHDGRTEVCETNETATPKAAGATDKPIDTATTVQTIPTPEAMPKPDDSKSAPESKAKEIAAKPDAKVAATVRRATPCCPDCYVDAVEPATDVLLSFLTEEQHRTWAASRYVVVRGQLTGHRYLIAHRNSPIAESNRRLAYDLDDDAVMHFHDWSVPPEEEVLSAMLVLGHREPWLRNEATCLGGNFSYIFKNPFGNGGDGVADSVLTQEIGRTLLQHLLPTPSRRPQRNATHGIVSVHRQVVPDGAGGLSIVNR